jgi:hypothetical protein
MSWKSPEEGESWITDPSQVESLFMERVKEGEYSIELWKDMNKWANAEALLERPGEEGARTIPITIFLTFLSLPNPERYGFLEDFIENRLQAIKEEVEKVMKKGKSIKSEPDFTGWVELQIIDLDKLGEYSTWQLTQITRRVVEELGKRLDYINRHIERIPEEM